MPALNAQERFQIPLKVANSNVSPNPRKRAYLWVLRITIRGDICSDKHLSHLYHSKNHLKKLN